MAKGITTGPSCAKAPKWSAAELAQDRRNYKDLLAAIDKFDSQEQGKVDRHKRLVAAQEKERQRQLDEKRGIEARMKEREAEMERLRVERLEIEDLRKAEEGKKKKDRMVSQLLKIKEEADKNVERRARMKQEDGDADKARMKLLNELQDEELRRRQAVKDARDKVQQERGDRMASGALAEQAAFLKKELDKVEREKAEFEMESRRKDDEKKKYLARLRREAQKSQLDQIAEHKRQKDEETRRKQEILARGEEEKVRDMEREQAKERRKKDARKGICL